MRASGSCLRVENQPVLSIIFARTKPVWEIFQEDRSKFCVKRLASAGPRMAVNNIKSPASCQTKPVSLQDGSISLFLKRWKNRVGEATNRLFLFAFWKH